MKNFQNIEFWQVTCFRETSDILIEQYQVPQQVLFYSESGFSTKYFEFLLQKLLFTIFYANIFMSLFKFMKISINYTLILVATIVWCAAIVLAPVLATMGNAPRISAEMYQFFGKVCHQIDSRSLHIGGEKFAVCARCSAIYFSFLAMLLVYPFLPKITIKESRLWILVRKFKFC